MMIEANEQCENCCYSRKSDGRLECRRYAPVTIEYDKNDDADKAVLWLWPVVALDEWCGEWCEK